MAAIQVKKAGYLLMAVPRVFEKVYNGAEQTAAAGGKVKIFRWAAKQSGFHEIR